MAVMANPDDGDIGDFNDNVGGKSVDDHDLDEDNKREERSL